MISRRHSLIGGLMLAGSLALGQASSVAAAELPDYSVASLSAGTYGRGLIMVRYSGTANVHALFEGALAKNESFRVIGRSIGCNGTPARSNRIFRVIGMTDDEGTLNIVATKSIIAPIRSFWIGPPGERLMCVRSHNYDGLPTTGDWDTDARAGLIKEGAGTLAALALATRVSNDQARLSVALDGDTDGADYVLIFAKGRCGRAMDTVHAQMHLLTGDATSGFKSKVVEMTQEQLDVTRSVRIVNSSTGKKFGCVPLSIIMANTEGDFH
jgi:hypothetical protein